MKKAFVILSHTHVPVTEGPHKGKFQVHETVEFVDSLKNRHYSNSTVIMEVRDRKFLKNRAKEQGATYELMEAHLLKGYGAKYREFLELVGAEVPEIMDQDKGEVADAETDSN